MVNSYSLAKAHASPFSGLLMLLLAIVVLPASGQVRQDDELPRALQQILDKAVADGAPGVQAFVRMRGWCWSGVAGLAVVEDEVAMSPVTPMRLASITKAFTASVILQLIDEQRLTLGDRVADRLPREVWTEIENAGDVTIEQLLDHSSGLHNFAGDDTDFTWGGGDQWIPRPADILAYSRGKPAQSEPGEASPYSNTNYILLGLIIESVDGQPLHQSLRSRIFEPLGMTHTSIEGREPPVASIAGAYHRPNAADATNPSPVLRGRTEVRDDGLVNLASGRENSYNAWAWASGSAASTATDLARFVDRGILSGRLPGMQNWKPIRDIEAEPYSVLGGSAWGINNVLIRFQPRRDIVIIVLVNASAEVYSAAQIVREMIAATGAMD